VECANIARTLSQCGAFVLLPGHLAEHEHDAVVGRCLKQAMRNHDDCMLGLITPGPGSDYNEHLDQLLEDIPNISKSSIVSSVKELKSYDSAESFKSFQVQIPKLAQDLKESNSEHLESKYNTSLDKTIVSRVLKSKVSDDDSKKD